MKYLVILVLLFIYVTPVYAGRGCCSHHGGESGGCTEDCHEICNDGTRSPTCTCSQTYCEMEKSNNNKTKYKYKYKPSLLEIIGTIFGGGIMLWYILGIIYEIISEFKK